MKNIGKYTGRTLRLLLTLPLGLALVGFGGSVHAAVTLPASAALSSNSVSNPGFYVKTVQASTNVVVANSLMRALKQIHGTLADANGNLVADVSIAGTNAGSSYATDMVNFERDSTYYSPIDTAGNPVWFISPDYFPGIPGSEGQTSQFAVESVGLVWLEAGTHNLAISANADRTDVNDDDGYVVYVGANPRDYFATKVAEFSRGGAAGFSGNQHVENAFDVIAPVSGMYPFRIVYWQQGRGANLAFYSIFPGGERWPINYPWDPSAKIGFRTCSVARFNAPYIGEISPVPNSAGNSAAAPIEIILLDGSGSTVNLNSIQLALNGVTVIPQVKTKTGDKTTVRYNPDAGRSEVNNQIRLIYSDSNGVSNTNTWSFTIVTAGGSATQVTGQWDFEFGDLRATVGKPLAYLDPTYDGPAGTAPTKTQFGTCSSLGVPLINGQDAIVMRVPGELSRRIGYVMDHGIAPNGGGTKVNQYTLIMDVFVENTGAFAASLLQIDSPNNSNDGDLFWQQGDFGQGTGGYNGKGTFSAGSWHRIVAAYDEAANPSVVTKYVDGIKQDDWTAGQGLDATRRALLPTAVLFGDGDQDERRTMWVNSIQIRSGKLSDAEMVALGGPDACGIPANIPQSTVSGQWDFEFGDLTPTVGKALQYLNPDFDGPTGTNVNKTLFGTCSALGVSTINGVDAKVMQVPGDLDRRIGYVMTHGIAPNGGGTKVNQYTLIMDVLVNATGAYAASLLNIDSTNNSNDGDLFWQQGDFGQGTDGYKGYGTFAAGSWHRIVAAYDEAANPPVVTKYVDGIKQDDWTAGQGLDALRRALLPTAVLFGDGDQDERRTMWVKSIQIRAGKLGDAQCALLGAPTGAAIPVVLPTSTVSGQWDFDGGDLRATIGKPLQYLDANFDGPTGTNINKTLFGTCSALGVSTINSVDAKVIQVPGDLDRRIGYVMTHGIAPNGGGTKVNQYTLIMDILVNATGAFAASLLQIDSTNNSNDGDLFWQQGNFGQGTGGYTGTNAFTAGEWHRIAVAYNEAASPAVVTKYADGIFVADWIAGQGLDATRRALLPTAILFGDGDQDERRTMWVDSIQIRAGALSKPELAALSTPSGSGLPVFINVENGPKMCLGVVNKEFVINWPLSSTGYTLESTSDLASGVWTPVAGVANNSKVIPIGSGNTFFRLRK